VQAGATPQPWQKLGQQAAGAAGTVRGAGSTSPPTCGTENSRLPAEQHEKQTQQEQQEQQT